MQPNYIFMEAQREILLVLQTMYMYTYTTQIFLRNQTQFLYLGREDTLKIISGRFFFSRKHLKAVLSLSCGIRKLTGADFFFLCCS